MPIHPTAIIEEGAEVHESATIGPYTLIESNAFIGEGCWIGSCVRIYGHTRLGAHNRIDHGATLGAAPQDLGFGPERAKPLIIGDHNHFRESVNISCGLKSEGGTRIGNHNYWMAFSHAGHDCVVGDHNVFANGATLAGHVEVGDHCFLSGQVAVHQFCRIGSYVMIGGVTGVTQDVPPYLLAAGNRARLIGLNVVGLRRKGFTQAQRSRIKQVYRLILRSGLPRGEALAQAAALYPGPETEAIIAFIRGSKRGVLPFRRSVRDTSLMD
ncbi:acyl-ACP--UDP-N-acetylglucosamine O-acyltransferase [Caldichromatium japonicum]|uniref:Acyl-ACP--UDP-N-acetylglucosamine O-acyltransferase n=1 Tax=Caldichromatium japonicum TaxID=2699430 RepID=A0A6G7VFV4_9GAMM|nr:acyl-ACP--UDP-N-acetylglucosamine O-acyltransferase [Caldichromatium japonicum]QIK38832.1 acyl-ACP--UDP-N-acetylglucosamine O-acyltransferase [Caldichromatium japonicum]